MSRRETVMTHDEEMMIERSREAADDDPQMRGKSERGHHVVGERDAPDGVLDHGDVVQIVIGTSSITVRNLFAELRVAGVDPRPDKAMV